MSYGKQAPGPQNRPLVGHLPEFLIDALAFLTRLSHEYGDVAVFKMPFGKTYLLSDPDDVEHLLTTSNRNFKRGYTYTLLRPMLGYGLVTSEGDFWMRQRRLSQPAFHRDRIKAYAEVMVDYTERALEDWQAGQTRNISEDMVQITMHIVSRLLFNADVSSDTDRAGKAIETAIHEFMVRTRMPFQLPESVPTPGNRRYFGAVKEIDTVINKILKERRASQERKDDLLAMLLEARDQDGNGMTDQQLRDEMVTLFIAGHETTAGTLAWVWYLLSQNPEVEAKLHAELDEVLGGRTPTIDDYARLKYTDAIVKETLRLFPVAWMIPREATWDMEIKGYHIPAGSQVWASPWVMHHDPRYFENPESFQPERWLDEKAKDMHKYTYFPFGGGPRMCIGNIFAQTEAVLLMATIAQKYRLSMVPGQQVKVVASATIRPKQPIQMILSNRQPAIATNEREDNRLVTV